MTDGIRKHPYSVLLMDEMEKAHQDIYNILLQVMDHATLTDNNGKKADFRNVVIIMTSNAGTREMSTQSIGFREVTNDPAAKGKKAIEQFFSPEFRNRLDGIISFHALDVEIMKQIVDKFVAELNGQLSARKVTVTISGGVRTWLAQKGHDPVYGARPLARIIQTEIKDTIADEILFGKLDKGGEILVDLLDDALSFSYHATAHVPARIPEMIT